MQTTATARPAELEIDHDKLQTFMGQMVSEMGAAMNAALVLLGDKLGLYRAMAGAGPLTSGDLASRTGTDERYVREWLSAQAAGGIVTYDPETRTFMLPDEHAFALAVPDSPAAVAGAFHTLYAVFQAVPKMESAFRTGAGLGWDQHDAALFEGTERFFRPSYMANLTTSWLPSLEGVMDKLRDGARVADIGCGHGASTVIMAREFPRSEVFGYDYHAASIEYARQEADKNKLGNVTFGVATAKTFDDGPFDLVTFFDCLHDMGDPVGAAANVLSQLKPDGTWMIVEPFAHDHLEHNLNPVGRVYYAASTMICTPASRAQEVGLCLGAQAGEAQIRKVVMDAGFTRFRVAAQTPFNLVFEARP